jgi:hypothetical protein
MNPVACTAGLRMDGRWINHHWPRIKLVTNGCVPAHILNDVCVGGYVEFSAALDVRCGIFLEVNGGNGLGWRCRW